MEFQKFPIKILNKFYPEITGIFVFIIYLFTLGRSLSEFDSGELALAQATLSIPHPTGYPLFTIIGFLFSKLPLPLSTIIKLNLLNSIWCSLTVVVLVKTSAMILINSEFLFRKNLVKESVKNTFSNVMLVSVFSGLMLAFSATFWLQSTKVEVYALQIFITSLIIYQTVKLIINYLPSVSLNNHTYRSIVKQGLTVSLLIALGFSNHLMTVYLLPALIFAFIFLYGLNKESLKSFAILVTIVFLIALLFYLGMMFRAQMSPPWSYGDPSNISRLVDHITARDYSKYLLDSTEGILKQSSKFLKMLSFNFSMENFSVGEFGFSLFLGIAGLFSLFLLRKEIAVFISLIFITSVLTAFSYNIPDINEYFLVVFFIFAFSSIIPINLFLNIIEKKKYFRNSLIFFLILLLIIQLIGNFNYANRSGFYVIEDFFKSSVSRLPKGSIFLTDNWGSLLSPALYYQNVENIRPDINFISPSGFIQFEWYRKVKAIEIHDSNYNIIPKDNMFIAFDVVYRIIGKNILKLPEHYTLIPLRNYYVLGIDTVYYPLNDQELKIRFSKHLTSKSEEYIKELIPFILEQRVNYEIAFRQYLNAKNILEEIKSNFPEYKISESTLINLHKFKII